jgi:hypothetical protein
MIQIYMKKGFFNKEEVKRDFGFIILFLYYNIIEKT